LFFFRPLKISPVDYSVFALSLLVPVLIALYYAFVQKQKTTADYMLGNRKIGAVPMAFSLTVSYLSAVTITGRHSRTVIIPTGGTGGTGGMGGTEGKYKISVDRNRKIGAVPMAFSLTVSYLSAVTITGRHSWTVLKPTSKTGRTDKTKENKLKWNLRSNEMHLVYHLFDTRVPSVWTNEKESTLSHFCLLTHR
jgi:hypothetical protein